MGKFVAEAAQNHRQRERRFGLDESSVEMHRVPLCSLSSADCRSSSLSSLSTRIACCKNC
jgi:hypothetical protein